MCIGKPVFYVAKCFFAGKNEQFRLIWSFGPNVSVAFDSKMPPCKREKNIVRRFRVT